MADQPEWENINGKDRRPKIVVIGGGAAGMMAAVSAAEAGKDVLLLEKNEKLGKKVYLTGKGRCNLTNNAQTQDLFSSVVRNPKFLYSAFYVFDPQKVRTFFADAGMPTKVERSGRVFPVSDHSSDVIRALEQKMRRMGVQIRLHAEVSEILLKSAGEEDSSKAASEMMASENAACKEPARTNAEARKTASGKAASEKAASEKTASGNAACKEKVHKKMCAAGVRLKSGEKIAADAVIVATGGLSYASTGSTGDGYRFAAECGHSLVHTRPSLVAVNAAEPFVKELQGLSLRNIRVRLTDNEKCIFSDFGEMLFTHYGVSGPVILSASSIAGDILEQKNLTLHVDVKPALTEEQLDARILREFSAAKNRQFKNAVPGLFPAKLTPVMLALSGIPEEKKVNKITRAERTGFVRLIKDFQITLTGLRGYEEAVITRGGVSVREVSPKTMESKKTAHLYFAGEVLDTDALTGGYNLQIAWSTGYLAGKYAG